MVDQNVTIKFTGDASGLAGAAKQAGDAIGGIGNAAKQAGDEVDGLGSKAKKAGEDGSRGFRGFVNDLTKATSEAALAGQAMDQVAGKLRSAGIQANQLSAAATEAAKGLDSARTKVSTLTNDVDGLQAALAQSSDGLKGQVSVTEALNASYDILSSGFSKTADTQKVLEASVKGAIGGFSDTGTVADALTSVLNSYNLSADQAASVTDKMIQTQNDGKIVVDQYAQQIGKVAPLAAQAGISLDELNGFIATATAKGVQAEPAFTGFRQAISATLKPSEEAIKLAESLGIQFDAQALKTKGLAGILGELKVKGQDTPEILTKLFGSVEAVAAIAPATGEGFAKLTQFIDNSANSAGAASTAFDKVSNSMEGQLKAASTEANAALVSLGNGVKTAVLPLVGAITTLVRNFNELPEPVKNATGVFIALTGGTLTLGAALLGVLAVLPAISAGWGVLTGAIASATIAQTATTAAATTATAGLAAENLAGLTLLATLGGLGAASGGAAAGSAAVGAAAAGSAGGLGAAAVAAGAFALSLLPLVAAIAATKVAIDAIKLAEFSKEFEPLSQGANVAGDAAIALANKIKNVNDARAKGQQLSAEDVKKQKQLIAIGREQVDALNSQLKAVQAAKPANEEQANQQKLLEANIKASIGAIESQSAALEKDIAAKSKNSKATADNALISKDAAKKRAEALREERDAQKAAQQQAFADTQQKAKTAQDTAKQKADEAFQDSQFKKQREFQDSQAAKDKANSEARQKREEEFQKQGAAIEKQYQSDRQSAETAFKQRQQQAETAFQARKDAAQQAFDDGRRAKDAAFAQQQQQAEAAFKEGQRQADANAKRQIDLADAAIAQATETDPKQRKLIAQVAQIKQAVQGIDFLPDPRESETAGQRLVELAKRIAGVNQASTADQAARLQAAYEALKAESDRRSQLGQAKDEQAFKEQQKAEEEAYKAQQRAEEQAYQAQVRAEEQAYNLAKQEAERQFQAQQQAAQQAYQAQKEARDRAFREQETAISAREQAQKQAADRAFEDSKRATERAFKEQQRAEDRNFQALQQEAERKHKEAMRQFDVQTAELVRAAQRSREGAGGTTQTGAPTAPPGRRLGGPVDAGSPYIVGEAGRELFIPSVSGTILNQQQAIANLDALQRVAGVQAVPAIAPIPVGMGELIRETRALRSVVEARQPQVNIPVSFEAQTEFDFDRLIRLQRATLRGML